MKFDPSVLKSLSQAKQSLYRAAYSIFMEGDQDVTLEYLRDAIRALEESIYVVSKGVVVVEEARESEWIWEKGEL